MISISWIASRGWISTVVLAIRSPAEAMIMYRPGCSPTNLPSLIKPAAPGARIESSGWYVTPHETGTSVMRPAAPLITASNVSTSPWRA